MKHIRWIAVVGLIAIVELQYVWLVNTYKLTRENVMRQSHELFKDAALQEAFDRISLWKQLYGKKDSTYTYQFKFEADVVDSDTVQIEETPETRQYIESAVFIAIQEGVSNTFKMDVSLHNLDSIYAHMLDSVGISAKVSTCMTDSLGKPPRRRKSRTKYTSPLVWCVTTWKAAPVPVVPPASSLTAWKKRAKSAYLSNITITSACQPIQKPR